MKKYSGLFLAAFLIFSLCMILASCNIGSASTEYKVFFDANGGVGTMDNGGATVGEDFVLASNVFTKDGFTFAGWALPPMKQRMLL